MLPKTERRGASDAPKDLATGVPLVDVSTGNRYHVECGTNGTRSRPRLNRRLHSVDLCRRKTRIHAHHFRPEGLRNMRKTATTQATAKSGDRKGAADWTRVRAMSDAQVRKAALADPDAKPLAKGQLARMRRVSRVKALRERMGLTQREFAEAFHLPLSTLRDWEQRRSVPDAPARALLLAIERDPRKMMSLLAPATA
jgi:putative transcriptional regulator